MTYYRNPELARKNSPVEITSKCPACGDPLSGATVVYDLYGTDIPGYAFHRDCAFEMAQRIICDAWPNRRDPDVD